MSVPVPHQTSVPVTTDGAPEVPLATAKMTRNNTSTGTLSSFEVLSLAMNDEEGPARKQDLDQTIPQITAVDPPGVVYAQLEISSSTSSNPEHADDTDDDDDDDDADDTQERSVLGEDDLDRGGDTTLENSKLDSKTTREKKPSSKTTKKKASAKIPGQHPPFVASTNSSINDNCEASKSSASMSSHHMKKEAKEDSPKRSNQQHPNQQHKTRSKKKSIINIDDMVESDQFKNQVLKEGSPIYGAWGNGQFYWGKVTKKYKDKGGLFVYDVTFNDGCHRKALKPKDLHRMQELLNFYAKKKYEFNNEDTAEEKRFPPIEYRDEWDENLDGPVPPVAHFYTKDPMQKYLQKTPIEKLDIQTGEVLESFDDGWSAFRSVSNSNDCHAFANTVKGMSETSSEPRIYKGFFWRVKGTFHLPHVRRLFKESLQNQNTWPAVSTPTKDEWTSTVKDPGQDVLDYACAKQNNPAQPMSLHDLYQNRCGDWSQCRRRDCGTCKVCIQSSQKVRSPNESSRRPCVQTMCSKIERSMKMQTSNFLPPEFTYLFEEEKSNPLYNGLLIFNLERGWFSFERIRQQGFLDCISYLGEDNERNFYRSVGINPDVVMKPSKRRRDEKHRVCSSTNGSPSNASWKRPVIQSAASGSPRNKRPRKQPPEPESLEIEHASVARSMQKRVRKPMVETAANEEALDPRILFKIRCKTCAMCKRTACGKCMSCRYNKCRTTRYPWACLRKVCAKVPVARKRQKAKGLDGEWTYYFDDPSRCSKVEFEDLKGLVILSPKKNIYRDVDKAFEKVLSKESSESIMEKKQEFYDQIGVTLLEPMTSPLLGAPWEARWIRRDGSVAFLGGEIVSVKENLITYMDACAVRFQSGCHALLDTIAQKTDQLRTFDGYEALDGCLKVCERLGLDKNELLAMADETYGFVERWLVPDMYHREMVELSEDEEISGIRAAPCATLMFRGYLIALKAKKSSIPNAGLGVYLSISKVWDHVPDLFKLQAGELLDIGVYAPFRSKDLRSDHEFVIKSLVHSYKNEKYCFPCDGKDLYLDVTDDGSGELHAEARKHIPPLVNESSKSNYIPDVCPRFDPEGSLHYLLGHGRREYGDFCFLADGGEREIFVDYGSQYEPVRVRENYPRTPMTDEERKTFLVKDENEYIEEIQSFNAKEVEHFVHLFTPFLRLHGEAFHFRIIAVAALMRYRAQAIALEFADYKQEEHDDDSICDNGATSIDLENLVLELDKMVKQACDAWQEKFGSMAMLKEKASQKNLFVELFTLYTSIGINELSLDQFKQVIIGPNSTTSTSSFRNVA